MSKDNKADLPEVGLNMQSLLGVPANAEVAELQKAYLEQQIRIGQLQEVQLTRQRLLNEESEGSAKEARRQGAINTEQKAERDRQVQNACPHLKPNFSPAIGGQRDGTGRYIWICAYCAKVWFNNELPMHLRVPGDRIGGPDYQMARA